MTGHNIRNSLQADVVLQGVPVSPEILPQIYNSPNCISGSVWIPGEFCDPNTISTLSNFNKFLVVQRHDFFNGVIEPSYIQLLQRELDMTTTISPQLFPVKLSWMLNREYQKWYVDYAKSLDIDVPHHDWYVGQFGSFVPSPLEPLYCYCDQPYYVILIIMIAILSIGILWILVTIVLRPSKNKYWTGNQKGVKYKHIWHEKEIRFR